MLPHWFSHYEDTERLQQAWQSEFDRRATGGAIALSGFHYQFLVAIHDTLRAWLNREEFERNSQSVLTECLSDIVEQSSNDVVIITQVKRTTRSYSLKDALTELWLIYELALKATPNLAPYLRFRILSRKIELKDFEKILAQWHPTEQKHSQIPVEDFRAKVTVHLFSDPEDEALALLANNLRAPDPAGYVQRWLGRLLGAASKQGSVGFKDVAEVIWNDLQSIENSATATPQGIYVWTSDDTPPEEVIEGDVLTGARPQVHHLRQGYFAPRPEVYQGISEEAQRWAFELVDNRDSQLRLPVFWIGGRSGSGKSVALMHVLASLYEYGLGPILWLGNKTDLLRQAVPWALKLTTKNRQVIIGIDDPYAPNTQGHDVVWKEALAVLESIRQEGDASVLPLIICCGPTEQADRMQRDLVEEVNVHVRDLPEEHRDDISQLRNWYVQRTKKLPPKLGEENVLLVQLFFEWETGRPLPEFASRFRNRIRESDINGKLEDVVTRMLCANRLYVGYSSEALNTYLTPELQDIFQRLREEHHIVQTIGDRGTGFWLAHAHLSNVIYESWYPAQHSRAVRGDHLGHVIEDSIQFGSSTTEKLAPLWSISNARLNTRLGLSAPDPLVGRVDPEMMGALLPKVYASRLADCGDQLELSELPVWIQIQAFFPNTGLSPEPINQALEQINVENLGQRGLRLTCHKLLQHYDSLSPQQRSQAVEVITTLLAKASYWHEWAPVANHAYKRTKDVQIMELIIEWVDTRPKSQWSMRLFADIFNNNSANPRVLNAARRLLSRVSGGPSWGDIAIQLLENSKSAVPLAVLQWTENNDKHWAACFLLGRLLSRGSSWAKERAYKWCDRWHTERSANYVLEPLLTLVGPDDRVRFWCMRWIAADHWNADSGFLVENLLKVFPTDMEVFSMGLHWLETNDPAHPSWPFVWRVLYGIDDGESLNASLDKTSSTSLGADGNPFGLRDCVTKNPALAKVANDPRVWYLLAIGLGRTGYDEEKITVLQKVTNLNPRFAEAWQALGAAYNHIREYELAVEANLELTKLRPDDARAWYYLSIALSRAGRLDDEKVTAMKAVELDPLYPEALKRLGSIHDRLGETEQALEVARKLVKLTPSDGEAWYYLSIATGKAGNLDEELDALSRATELKPEFADPWRNLGALNNQLGKYDQALAATLKLTELHPDDAEAWYFLSIAQHKVDNFKGVIAALVRATELDPTYADALKSLQLQYYRRGEYDLALEILSRLLELEPDDPTTLYHLGVIYFKTGKFKQAAAALSKTLTLDPTNALAQTYLTEALETIEILDNTSGMTEGFETNESKDFYSLARRHIESGLIEEGISAFRKAIQAAPDQARASVSQLQLLVRDATVAFRQESYERAIHLLKAVLTLDPNNSDMWSFLSRSYRRTGRDEEALDAARHLKDLTPTDALSWYVLGKRYTKLGQTRNAAEAFNRALELDVDLRVARRELNNLKGKKESETDEI